jgi:tetratricopeptide (TPR) repeat protein
VKTILFLLALAGPTFAKKGPPEPAWRPTDASKAIHKGAYDAFNRGEFDAALAQYNELLAVEPGCGQGLLGAGKSSLAKKDAASAVAPLKKAVELFPAELEPRAKLAEALYGTGEKEGALAEARTVLAAKPIHLDAAIVATAVLRDRNDWAGSRAITDPVVEGWNLPPFICLQGMAWAGEGDLEKAKAAWEVCKGVPDERLVDPLKSALGLGAAAP